MKGSYIIWHLLATCLKVTSCLRQRQTVSSSRQPPEFINKPFNGWCNIISITLHSFCDVMSLSCTDMHLSRWQRSRRRRSSASQMINPDLYCFWPVSGGLWRITCWGASLSRINDRNIPCCSAKSRRASFWSFMESVLSVGVRACVRVSVRAAPYVCTISV